MKPLIEATDLIKRYDNVEALSRINLRIFPSETLAVVGESGCGKSTLGKALLNLIPLTAGSISYGGKNIADWGKLLCREIQMIFQDPYASLNPRMLVEDIIGEGLIIHDLAFGCARKERIKELSEQVRLDRDLLSRYPHELSGGQRQRVGIARALSVKPRFIVCDEPVSALDLSTQNHILALLQQLKQQLSMTYLFITHDLEAVQKIADRVVVMYLGKIVEMAPVKDLFATPFHPYTQALLSAIPIANPHLQKQRKLIILKGEPESHRLSSKGCVFYPRCFKAKPSCEFQHIEMQEVKKNHWVRCPFV